MNERDRLWWQLIATPDEHKWSVLMAYVAMLAPDEQGCPAPPFRLHDWLRERIESSD